MSSKKPGANESSLIGNPGLGSISQPALEKTGEIRQILSLPGTGFAALLLVPALIAVVVAIYLSWAAITSSEVAGCSGGTLFDCGHVLHSKYSKFLGIPVSLLAAASYVVMIAALTTTGFAKAEGWSRQAAWGIVATCGLSAGMAALWFIFVQVFLLQHLCKYCLAAHTCGLLITAAILWKRPLGFRATMVFAGIAALGTSLLMIAQVLSTDPPKYEIERFEMIAPVEDGADAEDEENLFAPPVDDEEDDSTIFESPIGMGTQRAAPTLLASLAIGLSGNWSTSLVTCAVTQEEDQDEEEEQDEEDSADEAEDEERRLVSISGGSIQLDPTQWPLLGSPDAKHIFVEMYDYACPHCRNTHRAVKGACDAMGEDLAIILLPVPLNTRCNNHITSTGAQFHDSCELAKLAVACWRVDADLFGEFHHWMFEGTACPSYASAKQKAEELMGREAIEAELARTTSSRFVQAHVKLYDRVGRGNVPKLMFPATSIVGEYTSTNSLVDMIRRETQ